MRRSANNATQVVQSATTENKPLVRLPAPPQKRPTSPTRFPAVSRPNGVQNQSPNQSDSSRTVVRPAVTSPSIVRLLPPVANRVEAQRTHLSMNGTPPPNLAPQLNSANSETGNTPNGVRLQGPPPLHQGVQGNSPLDQFKVMAFADFRRSQQVVWQTIGGNHTFRSHCGIPRITFTSMSKN